MEIDRRLSNSEQRYVQLAFRKASTSNHAHHKMAAIAVKGGAVLSVACNLAHTGYIEDHHAWRKHAEARCLRPHLDYRGATLYVIRTNWLISKPCKGCHEVLKEAGIYEVVYYDRFGKPKSYKLNGE